MNKNRNPKNKFQIVILNLVLTALLFFVVEGIASSIIVVGKIAGRLSRERTYSQYDPELGWLALPNAYLEDIYGPEIYIETNSQHFRNSQDFTRGVPADKVRVICSGDSFTFGHGVDNENTWCQLLVSLDNRLETLNLGQVGYGIDQSYLWYKRNSPRFEHDIHVFAFITDDFRRTEEDTFLGYGKPLLALSNDQLINRNSPVPKRLFHNPRLIATTEALQELSVVRLSRFLFSEEDVSAAEIQNKQTQAIILRIFEDLQQINQTKNSIFVLVYLPAGPMDYYGQQAETEQWRSFLRAEAATRGWIFIDLVDELRKLPAEEIDTIFRGHYSEIGNAYIAETLYERLLDIPEIAIRLTED